MTLTEFLLARIAEDEAAATRMVLRDPLHCPVCSEPVDTFVTPFGGRTPYRAERCEPCGHELTAEQGESCFVPVTSVRVLAECEAKRGAIEAAWVDWCQIVNEFGSCGDRDELSAQHDNPAVLCHLALPYADHPDYCEEWKP